MHLFFKSQTKKLYSIFLHQKCCQSVISLMYKHQQTLNSVTVGQWKVARTGIACNTHEREKNISMIKKEIAVTMLGKQHFCCYL